jgi:hypothetical protein
MNNPGLSFVTLYLSIRHIGLKIFSIVFRVGKTTFKFVSWNSSVMFITSFIVHVKVPHFILWLSASGCVFCPCKESFWGALKI